MPSSKDEKFRYTVHELIPDIMYATNEVFFLGEGIKDVTIKKQAMNLTLTLIHFGIWNMEKKDVEVARRRILELQRRVK